MSTERSTLGSCPHCGAAIPSLQLLIEYEVDGDTGRYAECPACLAVVDPE